MFNLWNNDYFLEIEIILRVVSFNNGFKNENTKANK